MFPVAVLSFLSVLVVSTAARAALQAPVATAAFVMLTSAAIVSCYFQLHVDGVM